MGTLKLPIDEALPEIAKALQQSNQLLLKAETGAGKSTRVPACLLDLYPGKILVLEPRRLAARLLAERVCDERGEKLGDLVGYQVRFDRKATEKTRLIYLTEALLMRQMQQNPQLEGVSVVVLDEFHERHLHSDVALLLLKKLQQSTRPDLKLVVMSATLETDALKKYLGVECAEIFVPGRTFPVSVDYYKTLPKESLAWNVAAALKENEKKLVGHTLVFLPGMGEIRNCEKALQSWATQTGRKLCALHSELGADEQERALRPSSEPKIILSTNIAESALTLEGVAAVVDTGLARKMRYSLESGLPHLSLEPISQASAEQRKGRAGRTREGFCLRLYSKIDFDQRPRFDDPEILRSDLSEIFLALLGLGVAQPWSENWLSPPTPVQSAETRKILSMLGALDEKENLSAEGSRLAQIPLHPRLARLLNEAPAKGLSRAMALACAALSDDWRPMRGRDGRAQPALSDLWEALRRQEFSATARRNADRLLQMIPLKEGGSEADFCRLFLKSFSDRVAQKKGQNPQGQSVYLGCQGWESELSASSALHQEEWILCLRGEQSDKGKNSRIRTDVASALEKDWLLDLPFVEDSKKVFDDKSRRVFNRENWKWGVLNLHESNDAAAADSDTQKILAEALQKNWPQPFDSEDIEDYEQDVQRLLWVRGYHKDLNWPALEPSPHPEFLFSLTEGCRSFGDIENKGLRHGLEAYVGYEIWNLAEKSAPRFWERKGGRKLRLSYATGKAPWIAGRIQDFFGLNSTPELLGQALTLHLLGPNGQPLQVTQDLAGFWIKHYPTLKRELQRNYPKHSWPEDPLSASPPAPYIRKSHKKR